MSVQSEITRLQNAKAAIKTAIEGKGVTVPDGTLLDGMAALIDGIEAGGGNFDFSALNGATAAVSGTFTPASDSSYLWVNADFSAVSTLPRLVIVSPLTASNSSSALSLYVWLNTSSNPFAKPADGRSIYFHKYGPNAGAACTSDSLMNYQIDYSHSGHFGNSSYFDNIQITSNRIVCKCAERTAGPAEFLGGITYSYLVVGS